MMEHARATNDLGAFAVDAAALPAARGNAGEELSTDRHAELDEPIPAGSTLKPTICRICYAEEFEEDAGEFLRPTPCDCTGNRSAIHASCLKTWQETARKKRQWAAGTMCHACNSPYQVNLISDECPRLPVGIVGGTGLVGRALAAVLETHPIFCLGPVVGSPASAGKPLAEVWQQKESALEQHYGADIWTAASCPPSLVDVKVSSVEELLAAAEPGNDVMPGGQAVRHVISAIAPALGAVEDAVQAAGMAVFSISPHARQVPRNPLVVPEANGGVLLTCMTRYAEEQAVEEAAAATPAPTGLPLVKSPNCVTCGTSIVLRALDEAFGLSGVCMTTFQALSGRGDAKYEKGLVVGNVYPLTGTIEKTDEKIRDELLRILPGIDRCTVTAHRVPVQTGHFVDLKLQTREPVRDARQVKDTLRAFNPLHGMGLPSQPAQPIVVVDEVGRPRPAQDALYENGMAVAAGNVRCPGDGFFDITLSVVLNNVVRGAWGAALLNAEMYELHVVPLVAKAQQKAAAACGVKAGPLDGASTVRKVNKEIYR